MGSLLELAQFFVCSRLVVIFRSLFVATGRCCGLVDVLWSLWAGCYVSLGGGYESLWIDRCGPVAIIRSLWVARCWWVAVVSRCGSVAKGWLVVAVDLSMGVGCCESTAMEWLLRVNRKLLWVLYLRSVALGWSLLDWPLCACCIIRGRLGESFVR